MSNTGQIGNQAEQWNHLAHEKRFTISIDNEVVQELLRPESLILDYGCGYGRVSRALADSGFSNVIGVDISEEMVFRARAGNPDLRFATIGESGLEAAIREALRHDSTGASSVADATGDLPGLFDAILLVAVLTCIPDGETQRSLIRQLAALLRPGGSLFISDFVLQDDERNRERYERFAEHYGVYGVFRLPEGVVVRHHTTEWLDELTSGFQTIRREFPEVVTMNGNRAVSYQWVGKLPE